jgi:uncharacterized surface anchored protein
MRVSKAVRDYIEKQVSAKYPKTENEIKAEEISQIASKAREEQRQLVRKAKKEIADSIIAKYGLTEEMGRQQDDYRDYEFTTFNSPIEMKANTDRDNRRKAINQKIEDIIVTLELGGTKADLEKMLSEI